MLRESCEKEETRNLLIHWLLYTIKGCRSKSLKSFDENISSVFFDTTDLKLKNLEYTKITLKEAHIKHKNSIYFQLISGLTKKVYRTARYNKDIFFLKNDKTK